MVDPFLKINQKNRNFLKKLLTKFCMILQFKKMDSTYYNRYKLLFYI
nr:MAG TPA: hypothetical protein [Caudoviricetes sp.]